MKKLFIIGLLGLSMMACNKERRQKEYRIEFTAENIQALSYESYEITEVILQDFNKPAFSVDWVGTNKNSVEIHSVFDGVGSIALYRDGKQIRFVTGTSPLKIVEEISPE